MIEDLTACFDGLADPRITRQCDHRVHASSRSGSGACPTTTRLGLETGTFLSVNEALKLLDFA